MNVPSLSNEAVRGWIYLISFAGFIIYDALVLFGAIEGQTLGLSEIIIPAVTGLAARNTSRNSDSGPP